MTHKELVEALTWPDADELFAAAYAVKCREIGKFVSFRGLIEFGNVCEKDCYYCGIRKSNGKVHRYRMDADEIVHAPSVAKETTSVRAVPPAPPVASTRA